MSSAEWMCCPCKFGTFLNKIKGEEKPLRKAAKSEELFQNSFKTYVTYVKWPKSIYKKLTDKKKQNLLLTGKYFDSKAAEKNESILLTL